ncbi:glycosyl transferase family 1 [Streptomyces caelestis]|uniref:CelD/BcsL family acetyltransferase involved in cellulose biosynthesis n=2 Tax=Streptomyces caelestis TaxID=36816 RepID=A0A7W9LSS2_9ACTN|nr:CelD/BcsL family acetyltransferase involved in cellulose biosynthesis [Streptomyces caelestis]GGW27704.1 glycosyl transferase family 1 [Streptomyces caelestis]
MSAVLGTDVGMLRAELCTDEWEFAALGPAWERLYRRCAAATPFQSHAWLHSWWTSYGSPGRLRLVLVRDGGELLAVAPLMRVGRTLPRLVPLGGAITDYGDVLLDDEHADRAAPALAEALSAAARTALIDFREVRPGGAAETLYAHWRGPRRRVRDSLCLELPAVPVEELAARLPGAKARRARAHLRKLTALGVTRRTAPPDEVGAALGRLLALHRLQWESRGVTPEHLRERFAAHLVRAVGSLVRSGDALITEFLLDGEVVAVDLTLLSPRLAGCYLYGVHPRLRERKADIAVMLLDAGTRHAVAGKRGTLSLLRGDEPYKRRWRPEPVVNQRLLLARRRTTPLLWAVVCEVAARGRARELVRGWKERGGGRA